MIFGQFYALYISSKTLHQRKRPIFTARCTRVPSAVLRSHVVRLSLRTSASVRLSVTLVDC